MQDCGYNVLMASLASKSACVKNHIQDGKEPLKLTLKQKLDLFLKVNRSYERE